MEFPKERRRISEKRERTRPFIHDIPTGGVNEASGGYRSRYYYPHKGQTALRVCEMLEETEGELVATLYFRNWFKK